MGDAGHRSLGLDRRQSPRVALRQLEKRYPDASANVKDRAVRAKKNYSCT